MNKDDLILLHTLIDAYFDGQTTLEDERLLRCLLARTDLPPGDSDIEYARAVTGIGPALRKTAQARRRSLKAGHGIAAIIAGAVSAAACLTLILLPSNKETDMAVVYAHGTEIHNVDIALATMKSQLAEANMTADSQTDNALLQLKEFGNSWND